MAKLGNMKWVGLALLLANEIRGLLTVLAIGHSLLHWW